MKKHLEGLFLHEKPSRILTCMKGQKTYASVLAKEVDCTYSHCVRILQEMEKCGLVEFEKSGRIKLVNLTRQGEKIAYGIENLMREFCSN